MRKLFFNFAAVLLAVVSFAFTEDTTKATTTMYVFRYDPTATNGYLKENVEDISPSNWKFVGLDEELCSNDNGKACRIAVSAEYVDDPLEPTALQGVTITASQSGTDAHVTAVSGTGNQYSNQLD